MTKERKVEIPVDANVKEFLKIGKGHKTWDQYLIDLKKESDKVMNVTVLKNEKSFEFGSQKGLSIPRKKRSIL